MTKYILEGLDCASCAQEIETALRRLSAEATDDQRAKVRELKSLLKLCFGNGTGSDRPVRGKSITLYWGQSRLSLSVPKAS